jgi:hypothetical protein
VQPHIPACCLITSFTFTSLFAADTELSHSQVTSGPVTHGYVDQHNGSTNRQTPQSKAQWSVFKSSLTPTLSSRKESAPESQIISDRNPSETRPSCWRGRRNATVRYSKPQDRSERCISRVITITHVPKRFVGWMTLSIQIRREFCVANVRCPLQLIRRATTAAISGIANRIRGTAVKWDSAEASHGQMRSM